MAKNADVQRRSSRPLESKTEKSKIDAASAVAEAFMVTSGWNFTDYNFTAQQNAKMTAIAVKAGASEAAADRLIGRAQFIAYRLATSVDGNGGLGLAGVAAPNYADTGGITRAGKDIKRLAATALAFDKAWFAIGHQMRLAVLRAGGAGAPGATERDIAAALQTVEMGAEMLRRSLEANSANRPIEDYCAYRLAEAWHEEVGKLPAAENKDKSPSPFQRFVAVCFEKKPLRIGPHVLEKAVAALPRGGET